MNPLVKSALVGTGKHPAVPCDSGEPTDQLLAQRVADDPEKLLLLRAGALAIYQTAGVRTRPVPLLEAAPTEEGVPASPQLMERLGQAMSSGAIPLLPEFLQILREAGVIFPHALLPIALNTQDAARRELLRPVLGNRARWLAKFNAEWAWTISDSLGTNHIPRLQSILEEGTFNERAAALRELRKIDPAVGRAHLASCIATEKGDQKRKLLEQMRYGLSLEDESFLESFQLDRAKKVREIVCELLAKSIGSKLSQRMCDRGGQLLTLRNESERDSSLECHLPEELPSDWEQDGILGSPPIGVGPRGWWGRELMERVPPSFWNDHFQRTPDELVRMIQADDSAEIIMSGWVVGVVAFHQIDPLSTSWHGPLWDAILTRLVDQTQIETAIADQLTALSGVMSAGALDRGLIHLLRRAPERAQLPFEIWAGRLPAPWSKELSEAYLRTTRRIFQTRSDAGAARWCQTLLPAAIGISPGSFADALEPWSVHSDRQGVWRTAQLETLLQRFGEVIRTRHEFRDEATRCGTIEQTDILDS